MIERLRADPETRSATITTFQPLADTSYIPCVSLLDFWIADAKLELIVYAHSLDFGKKAYGNLVELARLQHEVATAVGGSRRAPGDPREVGARVRARARDDAPADRRGSVKYSTPVRSFHLTWAAARPLNL